VSGVEVGVSASSVTLVVSERGYVEHPPPYVCVQGGNSRGHRCLQQHGVVTKQRHW
jgi:hypothetical protein